MRAILHAAFNVGLLRHAAGKGHPHPGFLLLDSPLTTYKQGRAAPPADAAANIDIADDAVGSEIEQAFFKALAETPASLQIIVLENKIPSPDLRTSMHYEYFTGVEGDGRRGFIPRPPEREDTSDGVEESPPSDEPG